MCSAGARGGVETVSVLHFLGADKLVIRRKRDISGETYPMMSHLKNSRRITKNTIKLMLGYH